MAPERQRPLILGIETSCDDTACAVIDGGGRVLASSVSSQIAAHRPYGGVVPEVASREHLSNWPAVSAEALGEAGKRVEAYTGEDAAERARLEMTRDEKVRALQNEDKRYQIAKDLSDNLTVSYNTSEVVMARLLQTTTAKERVYAQAVSFFGTNEVVLTALSASFTGMFGLHEGTQTIEAMKDGVSKSLEDLADIGGKVQDAAIRAGYGPTIRAESVKKLVDSVVSWQTRSHELIAEMRQLATQNANEIRDAVEDGKRQLARLAQEGKGLSFEPMA